MPLRAAAICGLLAPVTFVVGLVLGDLAQPDAFSPADDNVSDIGAQAADQAWLYNQIAANLNGLLILGFALGLWRALGTGRLARLGALCLAGLGMGRFLEGFLRLDCRGMDAGCENDSWQATGHGIESGITAALFFLAPPLLALASEASRNGETCGSRPSSRCPPSSSRASSSASLGTARRRAQRASRGSSGSGSSRSDCFE